MKVKFLGAKIKFICRKYNSKIILLDYEFLLSYQSRPTNFGYNGLGEFVYQRTYSRTKINGENEQWYETVQRVVEGTFKILIDHLDSNSISMTDQEFEKIKSQSKIMYDKIFNLKFVPAGRGLFSMGTPVTDIQNLYTAVNSACFVSTKPPSNDYQGIIKPFLFLMDNAMLGMGVGYDTKGAELNVKIFDPVKSDECFIISDSRDGWVDSLRKILLSYFEPGNILPKFNYKQIRPAGSPLKHFGGTASGPEVLRKLHHEIIDLLDKKVGGTLTSRLIVDIMNIIGKHIISGNIRRTAEIALGEPLDNDFVQLKNYNLNPERMDYGWVSNNSIYANIGMDYTNIVDEIIRNGEPGLMWLENAKKYSRMNGSVDNKDFNAGGGNPCLEQTLESYELSCLAETFLNNHTSKAEFIETLEYAYLYTKIVTLGKVHWNETNNIISRNRRIGISMTGIAQFLEQQGLTMLKTWSEEGYEFLIKYDKYFSRKLNVPCSIKLTTIKPSGTVSLLGGATPGVHYPFSRFYIRRVRVSSLSKIVDKFKTKGYNFEPDVMQPQTTLIVSFPIDVGKGVKTIKDISLWEQLSLASFMQKYWADNQVSCTVSFKGNEAIHILPALNYFQYQLKGVSFMPHFESKNAYPQLPYEEIDEAKYNEMLSEIEKARSK